MDPRAVVAVEKHTNAINIVYLADGSVYQHNPILGDYVELAPIPDSKRYRERQSLDDDDD